MQAKEWGMQSASSAYGGRRLPEPSRVMPKQVWVRSFVPKLNNSAVCAISSAVKAPRGTSIIVPTR